MAHDMSDFVFAFHLTVFLCITVLSLWKPRLAIVSILVGLVLMDRNFAYIHLSVKGIQVYIVEWGLLLLLLRQTVAGHLINRQTWEKLPRLYRQSWTLWIAIAVLSVCRGWWMDFPISRIIRDSMLVFYSLWVPLILSMEWSQEQIRKAAQCLLIALGFKITISLTTYLFPSFSSIGSYFLGQPAAISLCICLAVLGLMAYYGQWSFSLLWVIPVQSILLSFLLFYCVRSSWIAFGLACCVIIATQKRQEWIQWKKWLFQSMILAVGTASIFFVLAGNITINPERPSEKIVFDKPLIVSEKALDNAGGLNPTIQIYTPPLKTQPRNPTAAEPTTTKPPATPKPPAPPSVISTPLPMSSPSPKAPPTIETEKDNSISIIYLVWDEILSVLDGIHTSNANTRRWMWQDAWMELTSTGLYSPITMEDVQKFNVVWSKNESNSKRLKIQVSGVGLKNEPLWIQLRQKNDPPPDARYRVQQIFQAAIGIPFGKLFLPIQVVWLVNSHDRYDPHNSLIAVLYRTGMIGIAAFALLIAAALFKAHQRTTESISEQNWTNKSMIFIQAGITYILMHALTDNVLENSFKGIWLWVLISLAFLTIHSQKSNLSSRT